MKPKTKHYLSEMAYATGSLVLLTWIFYSLLAGVLGL